MEDSRAAQPAAAKIHRISRRDETTEIGLIDILNDHGHEGDDIGPLDGTQKVFTKYDQQDMYRMGKRQELKVSSKVCF